MPQDMNAANVLGGNRASKQAIFCKNRAWEQFVEAFHCVIPVAELNSPHLYAAV